MDVQLTVKGYVMAARLWEAEEKELFEIARRDGGDWWEDWKKAGDNKRRCIDKAIQLLGDWDRLTDDEKALVIPF